MLLLNLNQLFLLLKDDSLVVSCEVNDVHAGSTSATTPMLPLLEFAPVACGPGGSRGRAAAAGRRGGGPQAPSRPSSTNSPCGRLCAELASSEATVPLGPRPPAAPARTPPLCCPACRCPVGRAPGGYSRRCGGAPRPPPLIGLKLVSRSATSRSSACARLRADSSSSCLAACRRQARNPAQASNSASKRRQSPKRSCGSVQIQRPKLRNIAENETDVPNAFISVDANPKRDASSENDARDICIDSTIMSIKPVHQFQSCASDDEVCT
mmetsp:Transcript_44391/g.118428  ORF Transcript_44391/g.118428 Transcript_44391/m.118428 type:complete len:268 (-) Transcript_44391:81-884(-)